jgi:hypothetical protein
MLYIGLLCSYDATKSVLRTMPCHTANSYHGLERDNVRNRKVVALYQTANLDRKIAEVRHFTLVLDDGRSGMDFSVHL